MKRTLHSALCVLAVAAITGVLWKVATPKAPASIKAQIAAVTEPVLEQMKGVTAPVQSVAAEFVKNLTAMVSDAPKFPAGTPTVLLSEPVVIIGAPDGTHALPKGTQVKVLKQAGHYVQVQHDHRVITIPRTATVFNVYGTN